MFVYRISCKFNNNLGTSKQTKIYHKSKGGGGGSGWGLANKTDNRRVSYKHRTWRILAHIK